MRRPSFVIAAVVVAATVGACAGGTVATVSPVSSVPSPTGIASETEPPAGSPPASLSVTAPATPATAPPTEAPMAAFTLTSTAFAAGALIPRRYTCDGDDVSPELSWGGVPTGTAALVLVVDDPDARGFVHWLVLDIPAGPAGQLPQGISTSRDAPAQGTNDFRRRGWGGPCPPSGEHRYTFTLHALGAPLGLAGAPRGDDVRRALGGANVLGTAVLEARYRRGG